METETAEPLGISYRDSDIASCHGMPRDSQAEEYCVQTTVDRRLRKSGSFTFRVSEQNKAGVLLRFPSTIPLHNLRVQQT